MTEFNPRVKKLNYLLGGLLVIIIRQQRCGTALNSSDFTERELLSEKAVTGASK